MSEEKVMKKWFVTSLIGSGTVKLRRDGSFSDDSDNPTPTSGVVYVCHTHEAVRRALKTLGSHANLLEVIDVEYDIDVHIK
jgi:hypothetical protein